MFVHIETYNIVSQVCCQPCFIARCCQTQSLILSGAFCSRGQRHVITTLSAKGMHGEYTRVTRYAWRNYPQAWYQSHILSEGPSGNKENGWGRNLLYTFRGIYASSQTMHVPTYGQNKTFCFRAWAGQKKTSIKHRPKLVHATGLIEKQTKQRSSIDRTNVHAGYLLTSGR